MSNVTGVKDALLEISKEALALFDTMEEDGTEAMYVQNSMSLILGLANMTNKVEEVRTYFLTQSALNLLRLGAPAASLLDRSPKNKFPPVV